MQTFFRGMMALVLTGTVAMGALAVLPATSSAADTLESVSAVSCPLVTMKHWKASDRDEKLAFLFGFASMLEMEKEWQGGKPLPIDKSIAPSWVRGLSGKTLGQLCDALDEYAAKYPDALEISVVEVLGRLYVAPQLTATEKKVAGAHYRQLVRNR